MAVSIIEVVDSNNAGFAFPSQSLYVESYPIEKPEIIIVTMTEHGGFGGSTSAPVTAQVAMSWFENVRGNGRFADYPVLKKQKWMSDIKPKKEDANVDIQ